MAPFVQMLLKRGKSIRKLYWVSPPDAGIVTPDIQQYVFDSISREVGKIGTMLDSRKITSYPYRVQAPDKEHFWGNESIAWGKDTFELIQRDLVKESLNSSLTLARRRAIADSERVRSSLQQAVIKVRVKLEKKTSVPSVSLFAPYGEFLVGYRYEVISVLSGFFSNDRILVFHPAYIEKQLQDLSGFEIGKTSDLEVRPFAEHSQWATVGRRYDVGSFEMIPFLQTADFARHPD